MGRGPLTERESAIDGGPVVILVRSLMDRSRLANVPGAVFVATTDEMIQRSEGAATVVVDLTIEGSIEALTRLRQDFRGRVVAFGPHVETEARRAALGAGADAVLARSRLLSSPTRALAGPGDGEEREGPSDR